MKSAALQLLEAIVDRGQHILHAHDVAVGVSFRRDFLIEPQGPVVVVSRLCDLVFFLRQSLDLSRVIPEPVATIPVAVRKLAFVARG